MLLYPRRNGLCPVVLWYLHRSVPRDRLEDNRSKLIIFFFVKLVSDGARLEDMAYDPFSSV